MGTCGSGGLYSAACILASPIVPALRLYALGAAHTGRQATLLHCESAVWPQVGQDMGERKGSSLTLTDSMRVNRTDKYYQFCLVTVSHHLKQRQSRKGSISRER